MPSTMRLLAKQTLAVDTATVTFSNIPQTYTDLYLVVSGRSNRATGSNSGVYLALNGSSSNFSYRYMSGNGSSASSGSGSTNFAGVIGQDTDTANTFSQYVLYLPNYTGSTNKSMSIEAVQETNAASAFLSAWAVLWSNTAPVTSLSLNVEAGAFSWKSGSTFFLYGITSAAGSIPGTFGVDATGGDVTISGGYKYHVFKSSGTFTVTEPGWAEVLVVGGGAGGGRGNAGAGGGGAGGLVLQNTLVKPDTYSVLVGGGGTALTSTTGDGISGTNSFVRSITSLGGGGGSGGSQGLTGGSGGGGSSASTTGRIPGLGTVGQGNDGGAGFDNGQQRTGGGGGGAGSVGAAATSSAAGNGGTGSSVFGTTYAAGGGGGSGYEVSGSVPAAGTGGSGIGGNGGAATNPPGNATAGAINTGSGGGGAGYRYAGQYGTSGAGGSGIVIIRYPVA